MADAPREMLVRGRADGFAQEITAGPHRFAADGPLAGVAVRLRHSRI
ncbi:MAG TPA: hypothetical protein VMB25_07300 [Bryobacteraceae bacterium]|nr:hypothetical protein [Bryobacteraceae bacterium]